MKEIVPRQAIQKAISLGDFWVNLIMKLLKIKELNKIYDTIYPSQGLELVEKILQQMNIRIFLKEQSKLCDILQQGPFITISNHPFGFLDGLTSILLIRKIRPDYKVTANFLLQQLEPLKDFFIFVNPFDDKKHQGMGGTTQCLEHLAKGGSVGLFPAGEVSTYYRGQKGVSDRPWPLSPIRLIQKAQVPVLPLYFHGQNSRLFHLAGKIHPLLRTVRLPAEFLRKRNSMVKVTTGHLILPETIQKYQDLKELQEFLRESVYSLENC